MGALERGPESLFIFQKKKFQRFVISIFDANFYFFAAFERVCARVRENFHRRKNPLFFRAGVRVKVRVRVMVMVMVRVTQNFRARVNPFG